MDDACFLAKGLEIAGCRPQRLAVRAQLRRFREMCGCSPLVVRQVWNDLQGNIDAKVDHLFWALCFSKRCPAEGDLAGRLQKDPKTIAKWVWTVTFGIADLRADKVSVSDCQVLTTKPLSHLLHSKIRFPTGDDANLVFIVSVDGTDCPIQEPRPFNRQWFSHKFKGAGVRHEVAICALTGKCAWMNGPFRAGASEMSTFRSSLIHLMPDGKHAAGDKGLRGEPEKVSAPNPMDDPSDARFKALTRARHETFDARLKSFSVLSNRFRHRPAMEKHQACFVAVAVLVQHSLELGNPLFQLQN